MIYPKDDPEHGIRVLDLRNVGEPEPSPTVVAGFMDDMGLDYYDDKDKEKIDYVILPEVYMDFSVINHLFENFTNLKIVYNLNKITSISPYAFSNCYSLSNSDLNNCQHISEAAFECCYNITTLKLKKIRYISKNAFNSCSGLTHIDISNLDIDGLESRAFSDCENLEYVTIKPGIVIPEECFVNCTNLKLVYNLNKCIGIRNMAFIGCSSLHNTNLDNCEFIGNAAFKNCDLNGLTNLQHINKIGSMAFSNSNITNIKISNNIVDEDQPEYYDSGRIDGSLPDTILNHYIFNECLSLKSVEISKIIDELHSPTIIEGCFCGCENLEIVYNLNICKYIDSYAFQMCYKLKNNDLSKCNVIGSYAFDSCSKLDIKKFNTITDESGFRLHIREHAFSNSALSKIDLSFIDIEEYGLNDCYNLTYIKIPKNYEFPHQILYCADDIVTRTIYNLRYVKSLNSDNFSNINLTNSTILTSDPECCSYAFVSCKVQEWNLPNLTTEQVVENDYYHADSGVTFHCKDGDVVVP